MTAHRDNRQATIRYLMHMADEMKKMAQGAFVPSLALLFDMAGDEARNFLTENAVKTAEAQAGRPGAGRKSQSPGALRPVAPGMAEITRLGVRRKTASLRQGGNHAAIMANKTPRKLKLHQAEIKA